MHRRVPVIPALVLAAACSVAAFAQDGRDDGRGWFVRTLEGMLSAPGRDVALTDVAGLFSPRATIGRVTVSDRDGVWLTIDGLAVDWSRAALLNRRLDVESLAADKVAVLRRPVAERRSGGGGVGLPLDVRIAKFGIGEVTVAAGLAGAAEAKLAAEGSAELSRDVAAGTFRAERKDRPGSLGLNLRLAPEDNVLTADASYAEPEGGIVAELLGLPGRPPLNVSLAGRGPLTDWQGALNAEAAGKRVLWGRVTVGRAESGYRIAGDLTGALDGVAPATVAALVGGDSRLAIEATRLDGGGIEVAKADLQAAGVSLQATGATDAAGQPRSADVKLTLGGGAPVTLPVRGGVSVASAAVQATLGSPDGSSGPSPWRLTVAAQGVAPADPALAAALGSTLKIDANGSWRPGASATVENARVALDGAAATFSGSLREQALEGVFTARSDALARAAQLAGRPLAGSVDLRADGRVDLRSGGFDLAVDGSGENLSAGLPAIDPLLAGATRIVGRVAKAGDRWTADALTLTNDRSQATLAGAASASSLDLSWKAALADLSALSPRISGRAALDATVKGTPAAPAVTASASGADVTLMGRPLTDVSARFDGVVAGPETGGAAELSGKLAGASITGSARLAQGEGGEKRLDNFVVTVGRSRLEGGLAIRDGLATGALALISPDLAEVAPLALIEASGMLKAEIMLSPEAGGQTATVSGTATDVVAGAVRIGSAEIEGRGVDLLAAPQLDGRFTLNGLNAGGLTVVRASGTAARRGGATDVTATAELPEGQVRAAGTIAPSAGRVRIGLTEFRFERAGLAAELAGPGEVTVAGGTATIGPLALTAGGGRLTLAGSAGAALNLSATLADVPASLADAFAPTLGAEGTVSGTAAITGSPSAPNGRFDLNWRNAAVAASQAAGVAPLAVTATGSATGGSLRLQARATGGGVALTADGTVGLNGERPLAIAVRGSVPLALANSQVANRGAALSGTANVNLDARGTAAKPALSGRITAEGGSFADPLSGVTLTNVSLAASVSSERVTIERLSAASGATGSLSGFGTIGLTGALPADLTATLRQARYEDGSIVSTRFDADLTLTGALAPGQGTGAAVLGGTVFLDRTEVVVPEKLPRGSVAVDVRHRDAPAAVASTLAKTRPPQARVPRARPAASARTTRATSGIRLDLAVSAPRQIFVRGRGLDAELGGRLTLTGTSAAPVAAGSFQLARGRLDLLTQRVVFDRGLVTFNGSLDPVLDFSGTTNSDDVTITVSVSGPASDPAVTLSSVPELPQDEVLARLVFDRGVGDLSPVQIARLADAAAQLSGAGGGIGILGQLRASTGLDDLDIVSDDEGAPALAAGRYVSENVYIGVQQGTSAQSSRFSVDLDITDSLKARAAVSPDGNSSLGVFFEREY